MDQAIACLTMHPDKAHVATGQRGSSPIVLVWDSASKPPKTKARLQLGDDKSGVSQVNSSTLQCGMPTFLAVVNFASHQDLGGCGNTVPITL